MSTADMAEHPGRRLGDERSASAPLWPLLRLAAPPGVPAGEFSVVLVTPFRRGLVSPEQASCLCLSSQDGLSPAIPIAARVLSTWGDGSVQWAAGRSRVPLKQEEAARMVIRAGTPEEPAPPVRVTRDEMGVLVDTGRMRVSMPLSGGFPLGNLWLAAAGGTAERRHEETRVVAAGDGVALEVTTSTGGPYRSVDAPDSWEVEDSSPHAATLLFRGHLVDARGEAGARYVLRATVHAGAPRVSMVLMVSAIGPRAQATGVRVALNADRPVTRVRLDDPSADEGLLDISLDPGEWVAVSTGLSSLTRVDVAGGATSHLVADGERGGHWICGSFGEASLTIGALDNRCDETTLSAGGGGVAWAVRLPERRMAERLTYELVLAPELGEALSDVAAAAVTALAGPVYALPETDYLFSTGALPTSLALLDSLSETGSEVRVAFADLTPESPHRENCVGTLLYALILCDAGLFDLGVRRARRWLDEGLPPAQAPLPAGARELLGAAIGMTGGDPPQVVGLEPDESESESALLALSTARDANDRLRALPGLARAVARHGAGELALAGISVLRGLRPSEGSPELRVLCEPPLIEALIAVGMDPDVIGPEFLAIVPAEEPVLVRPGDTRGISVTLANGLDVEWTANVFSRADGSVQVAPGHVRARMVRRSTAEIELQVSCDRDVREGDALLLTLTVAPTGLFGKIPPREVSVVPARDLAGHIGTLPGAISAALAEYCMPITHVVAPERARLDLLDLFFVCGDAHPETVRQGCDRGAIAGTVMVCLGLPAGVWFPGEPALWLEVEPCRSNIADPLIASDALFTRPLAILPPRLTVSHHIARMGAAWHAVAIDEHGRPVIVRAETEHGTLVVSLPSLTTEEGARYARNLVEWALGAAGI